jgi:hypothetical protein
VGAFGPVLLGQLFYWFPGDYIRRFAKLWLKDAISRPDEREGTKNSRQDESCREFCFSLRYLPTFMLLTSGFPFAPNFTPAIALDAELEAPEAPFEPEPPSVLS